MTLVVGIIGPPCSGKSTAAAALVDRGAIWINADTLAKEQLGAADVIERLVSRWGSEILISPGVIDRAAVADRVFGEDAASASELAFLESVIHPRVRTQIGQRLVNAIASGSALVVLDVPLLIESSWDLVCDEVLCVWVDETSHAAMIEARGWSHDELERRQRNQRPMTEKQRRSTTLLHNTGRPSDFLAVVADWWTDAMARSGSQRDDASTHCDGVNAMW